MATAEEYLARLTGLAPYRDPPYQGTQARTATRKTFKERLPNLLEQLFAGMAQPSEDADGFSSFQAGIRGSLGMQETQREREDRDILRSMGLDEMDLRREGMQQQRDLTDREMMQQLMGWQREDEKPVKPEVPQAWVPQTREDVEWYEGVRARNNRGSTPSDADQNIAAIAREQGITEDEARAAVAKGKFKMGPGTKRTIRPGKPMKGTKNPKYKPGAGGSEPRWMTSPPETTYTETMRPEVFGAQDYEEFLSVENMDEEDLGLLRQLASGDFSQMPPAGRSLIPQVQRAAELRLRQLTRRPR